MDIVQTYMSLAAVSFVAFSTLALLAHDDATSRGIRHGDPATHRWALCALAAPVWPLPAGWLAVRLLAFLTANASGQR